MKKVLSLMLALVMMFSLSVCAFAADTAVSEDDKVLEAVPVAEDITIADDHGGKIHIASLLDLPDDVKAVAKEQIEKIQAMGYKVQAGFAITSDDKDVDLCSVQIPQNSLPEDAVIFVNGQRIQAEEANGEETFDVSLSDVVIVLIAVRETKAGAASSGADAAAASGSSSGRRQPQPEPHYDSPTYNAP